MLSFQQLLGKLGTFCLLFAFTIAHDKQPAPSSTSLATQELPPLETNSQIQSIASSNKSVFTFTPPFASQTFVSISLPICPPHDHSLSPLGCREPSTSISPQYIPASTSINLPAEATNVVWKTIRVTVTKTRTVFRPRGSTLSTQASNSKEPEVLHRAELGSITKINSSDQITIQAIITVTSVLDSWGIPQEPDTYTSPPLSSTTADSPSTSTTVTTITIPPAPTEPPNGNPSPTVRSQYPPPTPCSANVAQYCVAIGGRTFVVDVSNGQAVLPTDSVLHSTATERPDVIITPVTEPPSSEQSPTPSSTSISSSSPTSVPSSSTSSNLPSSSANSTSSSQSASIQTSPTTSTGLRKTKNPWLLLAVCCAGAMMYEMGVWTEKSKEEKSKTAEDEKKANGKNKTEDDKVEMDITDDTGEGGESADKAKENVEAKPSKEMLNEWNIV
ncbi:hypothetical protein DL98DRAFT_587044 [Cadophora sp. DSE1049]|nr:hypothetical protein DL98DRAFT_587044 [Cadophora sp. DSE1049]